MSFSGEVKEELCRRESSARHCRIAEMMAVIYFCGRVSAKEQGPVSLILESDSEKVIKKYFTLLEKTFNIDNEICERVKIRRERAGYILEVMDEETVIHILEAVKMLKRCDQGWCYQPGIHPLVVQKECCKRAFLRGAFLTAGSVSDPNKSYHLEIVCLREEDALALAGMMQSFSIDAKVVNRKKYYITYIKEGYQIVDFLALIEANVALMEMENVRILKEVRNLVNRKVNCETANINKTVSAAVRQVEDIAYIRDHYGLDRLKPGLAQAAEIRLKYPQASLKELGELMDPPVGKSGMNHRLRRLSELADKIRKA